MEEKQKLELELQVWQARMNAVQVAAAKLQVETELVKYQANDCQREIARLQQALAAIRQEEGGGEQKPEGGGGEAAS